MIDRLLTLEEVADVLGVHSKTVRTTLVRKRGLPSLRVGNRLRFRREDLDRWIETERARERSEIEADRKVVSFIKWKSGGAR